MQTIYDWITLAVFAGLIVLFLQRSTDDVPTDRLWQYLPPAVGCAFTNWLGNRGDDLLAIIVLALTFGYIGYVLKPFPLKR
ncbi:XrtV sorting system accessory protein [Altericroceibacterium xinjiangense]|uniref:XrtV sorting system accessory protein n=1 Tax=Altericroceibacterium xinjiangense TaxID=762261 RepID=UPI000F7D7428|nr:XrtV sorting system accessory protein [Altericroceibacterium xinjiangense]